MSKITKIAISVFIVCCLGIVSFYAYGGLVETKNIWVTSNPDGSGYVTGNLGDIRRATGTVAHLGCQVSAYDASIAVTCTASYLNGNSYYCSSAYTNASNNIVQAALSITDDSYVYFGWDANHKCTRLDVIKDSKYSTKNCKPE
jgi:hypothetical protein